MSHELQRVDYFYTVVKDQPGEAYKLLSTLANLGVDLLAFAAVPVGPARTELTLFPKDSAQFTDRARNAGMTLEGPHRALLVKGDDELGALAKVHMKLYDASVNVYASTGVADGRGSFGYVIYVKPEDFERAAAAFGV